MRCGMRRTCVALTIFLVLTGLTACSSPGSKKASDAKEAEAEASPERKQALAEATRNVGEAYLSGGNLLAALRELKKAEALNPDDHITQFDLGLAYYYRDRYDQAIEHLQRAIRLKPDYAPAINTLGNTYSAMGQWDKAIEIYEKIIEDAFYGTPHFVLSNMGVAYYQKKDYAQAEHYFMEALKINPDFNALAGLGAMYIDQGRYDEAVVKLGRAVRKDPKVGKLHFELGRAYRGQGDTVHARAEFSKAAELAPDTPLAAEAQKELKKIP
jgi:type IV pilus assembly protein PilF